MECGDKVSRTLIVIDGMLSGAASESTQTTTSISVEYRYGEETVIALRYASRLEAII